MMMFVLNSLMLGVGLAMDAFSVSLANGLADPGMSGRRQCLIAGIFALFQFAMPLAGWTLLNTLLHFFHELKQFIPWIALFLLLFIGGRMLLEGLKDQEEAAVGERITFPMLLLQGIATSIDALSAGLAFTGYTIGLAIAACAIIAAVTWILCMGGLRIGKYFGTKISGKAQILGGIVLIFIGVEIFVRGLLG